jgi:hypothetical protein
LSIQADIPKFFGQFAGVLIMLSLIRGLRFLASANNPTLGCYLSDRRDIMVPPRTIFFAKVAVSDAILGLAVLALNFAVTCHGIGISPESRANLKLAVECWVDCPY